MLAPDFESIDHRRLGTWSLRGAAAFLDHFRALREVASEIVFRDHAVLALEPNAKLVERMHSGNERLGGGVYERLFLALFATDDEGRLARIEWFDADHEAEALARFDALVAGEVPKRSARLVRANAATRNAERVWAAIEACDEAALLAAHADPVEVIHHPTGVTYGVAEVLALHRGLWRGRNVRFAQESLGALGDSLALLRTSYAHDGVDAKFGSVGPVEGDYFAVFEVDGREQRKRSEVFADDRLGNAVARLYQRYAELLPDGPDRERAVATARSVAVWNGSIDPDRVAATTAPLMECVDHRSLHLWSARGANEFLEQWRGQLDLATGSVRHDDVLALAPDILLVRQTYFGNERTTGGFFDHPLLALFAFGPDGLLTRAELWESDREADALARFAALTTGPPASRPARRRLPTAARGAMQARFDAALAARDMAALEELFSRFRERVDHPTGAVYGRDGLLKSLRSLLRAKNPRLRFEPLGHLGDRLDLTRHWTFVDGTSGGQFDVAAFEREEILVSEVDEDGFTVRSEYFAADHLGDALVRLYERHAELLPDGSARARAAAAARATAGFIRHATDPDRHGTTFAPAIVAIDHRTVGFGELHGRDAVVAALRALHDPSDDVSLRLDDVLALSDHASVLRATQRGRARASGGAWERPVCSLRVHDADGLARWELFEPEQEDEALARYDALVGSTDRASAAPEPPFANAASRAWLDVLAAWARRDAERFAALHPRPLGYRDHRRLFHLDLDREQFLDFTRPTLDMAVRASAELLATRGERLALKRFTMDMAEDAVGPSAIDSLLLIETDEGGEIVAYDRYDLDDVVAWAELDARWAAGEAAAHGTTAEAVRSMGDVITRRDWDAYAALRPERRSPRSPAAWLGHDARRRGYARARATSAGRARSRLQLSPRTPPHFGPRPPHTGNAGGHA